ncbi:unnamed protein product [Bursaphelenchus xylophilus]|uniref:Elongator complex protein 2 n=1 Tax=Bursaphelenchus xylophilus TaxID=6326 RepID=A0A1I7S2U1_BURXY|nr:unnamed protein product [Bursaphelenchus xylophilus]CAG9121607.1 unnamed protein product [Bursaphelenchus xylophilus]
MSNTGKFGLLSLGVAPRHCSLQWVSENRLVYCGLSDVCVVSNNSGGFVPEVILSIISYPNTFRSLRLVDNPSRTDENFEVISTTTDGTIVLAKIFKEDGLWKYRIVYEDKITANQMVDAFAFRKHNNQLVLAFATFSSIEIRFFNEDYSYVSSKMKALSSFLMVQCLGIQSLDQNFKEFLVIFGQTNKKLGLNRIRKPESESVEWEAKLLDSKEAVFYLDSRISASNASKIELLAATECRVQIWSIEKTTPLEAESNADFSGFNLESKTKLKFDDSNHYEAHLDSNILASQERICGAKWDYSKDIFSISTRENSIKIFALEKNADSELWLLRASVCSYGEPALELFGVFDAQFSPSNSFFLAHNTVGGFYLFQVEQEDNTPIGFNQQPIYIGGHSGKVRSICWADNGRVLLSVGADKTTRYFKKFENGYWAQKSRPQVHGHALRCVTSIGSQGFVSGAAEHMFRVFGAQVPQLSVQEAIERIQPLNLTPKPQAPSGDQPENSKPEKIDDSKPTIEEYLQSGATAHEEIRKLYGHGNECYVTASSNDFVFTSAKGSRPDEAQMIVWSIGDWKVRKREIRHNSTITDMAVSKNGEFLVTVSRDRTLNLYKIDPSNPEVITHLQTVSGLFKRVIWTVAFHQDSQFFAAGTRDGQISVFKIEENQPKEVQRWKFGECISALEFGKNDFGEDMVLFATENGNLYKVPFNGKLEEEKVKKLERESGFSGGSLVYRIKFNSVENLFALCTETGAIKFISI